jgi:hypothetical protein
VTLFPFCLVAAVGPLLPCLPAAVCHHLLLLLLLLVVVVVSFLSDW